MQLPYSIVTHAKYFVPVGCVLGLSYGLGLRLTAPYLFVPEVPLATRASDISEEEGFWT